MLISELGHNLFLFRNSEIKKYQEEGIDEQSQESDHHYSHDGQRVKIGIEKADSNNKSRRRANHLDGEQVVMYPKVYINEEGELVRQDKPMKFIIKKPDQDRLLYNGSNKPSNNGSIADFESIRNSDMRMRSLQQSPVTPYKNKLNDSPPNKLNKNVKSSSTVAKM